MKFRPLNWRMAHPYLLTDRLEVHPLPCLSSLFPSCCAVLYMLATPALVGLTASLQLCTYGNSDKKDVKAGSLACDTWTCLRAKTLSSTDAVAVLQDITPVDDIRLNPKCDREIAVYGYLRGTKLKGNARVHIAGVGDASVSHPGVSVGSTLFLVM